jgi:hypothetical protein
LAIAKAFIATAGTICSLSPFASNRDRSSSGGFAFVAQPSSNTALVIFMPLTDFTMKVGIICERFLTRFVASYLSYCQSVETTPHGRLRPLPFHPSKPTPQTCLAHWENGLNPTDSTRRFADVTDYIGQSNVLPNDITTHGFGIPKPCPTMLWLALQRRGGTLLDPPC